MIDNKQRSIWVNENPHSNLKEPNQLRKPSLTFSTYYFEFDFAFNVEEAWV
jgi:hypothetical protein